MTKGKPAQKFFTEVVLTHENDECLFWPFTCVTGYAQMSYRGKSRLVPRILCEIENGPPPSPLHQAAHSCGKGMMGCVAKRHLSWKTPVENDADKVLHGTSNHGIRHGHAKLCDADILVIRSLQGSMSITEIARRYNLAVSTIHAIITRKSWAHIDSTSVDSRRAAY